MDRQLRPCGGGICRISDKPSFASTLLNSVYRSIDEDKSDSRPSGNHDTRVLEPNFPSSVISGDQITATQPEKRKSMSVILQHRAYTYTISSSSDRSSNSGFSSSDTETVFRPRIGKKAPITWPGPFPEKKNSKSGSIRSKLRELRLTRLPVSPRARMAKFLNSLFMASAKKVPKTTDETIHTTSTRSCLSKTGSLRERPLPLGGLNRSVRFDPVSDKCLYEDVGMITGMPLGQRRMIKGTVEEQLLRRFEDDEVSSDSSSDLFELENLNAGVEAGGGYRDELPVFETTHLGAPSLRF